MSSLLIVVVAVLVVFVATVYNDDDFVNILNAVKTTCWQITVVLTSFSLICSADCKCLCKIRNSVWALHVY